MERSADVVVVGGGISGCAIAYNLAKRGQKVVLLEKDDIAFEASGRTVAAVGLLGKQEGEFLLAQESLKLYDRLKEELSYDVEFIKGGRLVAAEDYEDIILFEEMVAAAEEAGVELEVLGQEEVRRRFPYVEGPFHAIAYSADEGHVNPVRVVNGFARAAREYGANIYPGCLVTDIGVTGGIVTSVETSRGEIKTDVVVNAAGVWASRLADRMGMHIPIQIIRLAQGETEPVGPIFEPFIRSATYCTRQTASGTVRVSNGYRDQAVYHDLSFHDFRDLRVWLPRLVKQRKTISFRLDLDLLKHDIRAFLASMRRRRHSRVAPVGLEAKPALRKVRKQLARAARLVPKLEGLSIRDHWAGFIDMTPDLLPVIGPVEEPKGLYLAMGFSGHGFALGPIVGKLMAELIIDGKTSAPINPFRMERFAEGKVQMPSRLM
ncbi:MAG: FAD-binding oxidoreductase [Dehalococcoidia bacterium]